MTIIDEMKSYGWKNYIEVDGLRYTIMPLTSSDTYQFTKHVDKIKYEVYITPALKYLHVTASEKVKQTMSFGIIDFESNKLQDYKTETKEFVRSENVFKGFYTDLNLKQLLENLTKHESWKVIN